MVRRRVLLIGPLNEAVIDVVARHHRAGVGRGKDQPRRAHAVIDLIALEEMVTSDDAIAPGQQRKVAELGGAAVAQFNIIGIGVQRDAGPVWHRQRVFGRKELAAVDQHPLTTTPDRGNAAIHRATDEAIPQMENQPRRRENDRAAPVVALKLDVGHHEFRQRGKAAEIHQILELTEGEILRTGGIKQRCVQRDFLRRHIL